MQRCKGHPGQILALAFSPDLTRLASSGDSPEVCLWNTATVPQFAECKGLTSKILFIAFRGMVCGC
jgi:WD40 repeat protein